MYVHGASHVCVCVCVRDLYLLLPARVVASPVGEAFAPEACHNIVCLHLRGGVSLPCGRRRLQNTISTGTLAYSFPASLLLVVLVSCFPRCFPYLSLPPCIRTEYAVHAQIGICSVHWRERLVTDIVAVCVYHISVSPFPLPCVYFAALAAEPASVYRCAA